MQRERSAAPQYSSKTQTRNSPQQEPYIVNGEEYVLVEEDDRRYLTDVIGGGFSSIYPSGEKPEPRPAIKQDEQEVKARELAEQKRQEECRSELEAFVKETLTHQGYLPPEPSPLVLRRTLNAVTQKRWNYHGNPAFHEFLSEFDAKVKKCCATSDNLLYLAERNLRSQSPVLKMLHRMRGIRPSIDRAMISSELPDVKPELKAQMQEIEVFLARDWSSETHRGVMAVHVDKLNHQTIIQIGIAEHGPIYVTIPEVLRPESAAMKSIVEVLRRLAPFTGTVDPMAIIDGAYEGLNYNEVFRKARVYRAPSGNTTRLARNLQESRSREKLSAQNTRILNSAPKTVEEYLRIFPEDLKARNWDVWGNEAQQWSETATANQFALSTDVSQQALLTALTESKNVIVIVAHCDGQSIFMPEPPPEGSTVTADYLRTHAEEIAANAPFVYLFSCQAGALSNVKNFASTLLDCGASGVVASQTDLGSPRGRELLRRLLDERRTAPPLEDYYQAMQDVDFREMEVFIA